MARIPRLDFGQARPGQTMIGLVSTMTSAKGDLVLGLGRILQPVAQPFRIRHRHHGVKPVRLLHVLVDEKGLCYGAGIGEAVVSTMMASNLPLRFISPFQNAHKIARTVQAHAAIVHSNTFLAAPMMRSLSDADFADSLTITAYFLPCFRTECG